MTWPTNEMGDGPSGEKKVILTGRIVGATYHPEYAVIAVQVALENKTTRTFPLYASSFRSGGRNCGNMPKEEADREMAKVTALFQKLATERRQIKVEMYES